MRALAVYGAIAVVVAAMLWPNGAAARAVKSVGDALAATLHGTGNVIGTVAS